MLPVQVAWRNRPFNGGILVASLVCGLRHSHWGPLSALFRSFSTCAFTVRACRCPGFGFCQFRGYLFHRASHSRTFLEIRWVGALALLAEHRWSGFFGI